MTGRQIFKLKPLFDAVIVKPITNESKTASGLVIPDIVQDDTMRGVVVAVGEEVPSRSMYVRVDDVVVFNKNIGHDVIVGGENYVIIKISDVLAIEKV